MNRVRANPARVVLFVLIFGLAVFFFGRYFISSQTAPAVRVDKPWLQIVGGRNEALADADGLLVAPGQKMVVRAFPGHEIPGFYWRLKVLIVEYHDIALGCDTSGRGASLVIDPARFHVPFHPGQVVSLEVIDDGLKVQFVVDGSIFSTVVIGNARPQSVWLAAGRSTLRVQDMWFSITKTSIQITKNFRPTTWGTVLTYLLVALILAVLFGVELLAATRFDLDRGRLVGGWLATTFCFGWLLAVLSHNTWLRQLGPLIVVLWFALRARYWLTASRFFARWQVHAWRLLPALLGLAAMGLLHARTPLGLPAHTLMNGIAPPLFLLIGMLIFAVDMRLSWLKAIALCGPALSLYVLCYVLVLPGPPGPDHAVFLLLPASALLVTLPLVANKKQLRVYGLYMLGASALMLASLEIALRNSPIISYLRPMGIGKTYDPDRDLFWAPKAFFSWENGFEGRDDVRVRVLNFRGKTGTRREKAPGTIRILTVGGSNVYGDGIADNEHTFSGRLEQLLRARGVKAEVLNGGVRGYNSTQLMVLLRKYALSYHPDIVILYLMRNDIYVDKARYTYRELWLAGNEPWTRLRRQLQRSYLYDAMTSVILDARENMRTQWYDPGLWKDANPPQDFAANLRDMINDAQHAGAKVIAVSEFWGDRIPHEFHNERMEKFRATMEQAARRMGVPYYDAYDHFMAAPDPWIWVFPKDRTHFNYEGHAEMARYLENILIQNKLIPAGD